ncbi:MAG TPA: HD domain-containing protein [Gemmatales bacterium]|nr:HD domain-containing protein [Gemmatales bacterium]HMP60308.1 HD domain-containing protein [Gemmatales bacterium]
MPNSAVPFTTLEQLQPNQLADCFALLVRKQPGTTRTGRPYFTCQFRDARRVLPAQIWQESPWLADCDKEWHEGLALRLRVKLTVHEHYGPQLDIHDWRRPTEADVQAGCEPRLLIEASRFPVEAMWSELIELVTKEIASEPLRRLVLELLAAWRIRLVELPASDGRFHPFRGGWLEHTLSLLRTALGLTDHYLRHYAGIEPTLDRDLVAAGAVLHDVGRAAEWEPGPTGSPRPTVPGRLFGHLMLGRDLVRSAALRQGDVPGPLREKLEHLILSHLVLPEWGSPRLPLIPEVLIIHHADDLDAKLEMYLRCLSRDTGGGDATARDGTLNRPLLKATDWPSVLEPPAAP